MRKDGDIVSAWLVNESAGYLPDDGTDGYPWPPGVPVHIPDHWWHPPPPGTELPAVLRPAGAPSLVQLLKIHKWYGQDLGIRNDGDLGDMRERVRRVGARRAPYSLDHRCSAAQRVRQWS